MLSDLTRLPLLGGGRKSWYIILLLFSSGTPSDQRQAVRWSGIPKVARSRLTEWSKSCDLQPALHCAIRGAQGVLPCVGWVVRLVNWIYRL